MWIGGNWAHLIGLITGFKLIFIFRFGRSQINPCQWLSGLVSFNQALMVFRDRLVRRWISLMDRLSRWNKRLTFANIDIVYTLELSYLKLSRIRELPGQYSIGTSLSRWSVFNRRQQTLAIFSTGTPSLYMAMPRDFRILWVFMVSPNSSHRLL